MEKITYFQENQQLFITFTSPNNLIDYKLDVSRGNMKYSFTLEEKQISESNTYYKFSLSLEKFGEFLLLHKDEIQEDSLDNVEEEKSEYLQDSYKFIIYVRYHKYNDEIKEYTPKSRILRLSNKADWQLKGLDESSCFDGTLCFYPYITKKGGLALLVNKRLSTTQYFWRRTISKITFTESDLHLSGNFTTRFFDIDSGYIELVERGGNKSIRFPVDFSPNPQQNQFAFGRRFMYKTHVSIYDFKEYLENFESIEELALDFFFVIKLKETDGELKIRVGNPRFVTRYFMKGEMEVFSEKLGKWLSVIPYFTLKGNNLSFTYTQYDKDAYEYYRSHRHEWKKISKASKEKNIWIIGERSYKAQDNGFHFFKYLRINHPEIDAYYVIQKNSPERGKVEPFGNIIDFNSKEHFERIIEASYICGTHHPDSLYPIRSKNYTKYITAKKVFLQHGVFGTKNISPIYAKWVQEFSTDLFITSSEKERQLAIIDMDYRPEEVVVTGLSRFESLFKEDVPVKRQLLIIPTWRDWITNSEIFESNEYLQRYRELLFDSRLKTFSERYDIELIFCLHPNMQDYLHYFKDAPVTVVKQGDRDVQELIKESLVMITDYSSVAFDFSFLHKPIIYYQFDRQRFLGKYPSHLDLDNELPGDIVDNENALIDALYRIAENDFSMDEKYKERANAFIKNRDGQSNERIFEAIEQIPDKSKLKKFFEKDPLVFKLKSKFRRSKAYFPSMKLMYWFISHFSKVKKNRILFESGLGKRYEDSPRAIYEKMVENGENFEYIWVMNNNLPLKVNNNTKVIKRLSIDYFKYLATSGIWVNNQNFPYYLKKRRQTKYLQTWHGTPLKKMQHDLEKIEGRDSGYLKRVTKATNQWSCLLSPSPYATKAFQSAFDYNGSILEVGYPRNDVFYEEKSELKRWAIREQLGIPKDKKVALYAPTFRDNQKKGKKFTFKNKINLRIFNRRLGKDYVLLIREHVVVASKLSIPKSLKQNVIDVSKYPNIQDLMLASDLLITDYSSAMFDYLNTQKPIYFYCYDLDEYDDMRGFYFDFEKEAPGPIIKNTTNLCREISKQSSYWEDYQMKYEAFQQKFIPYDGPNSSEKAYRDFLMQSIKTIDI